MSVRIQFNSDGFREILQSAGVKALVEETANDICSKANANLGGESSEGYDVSVISGGYGGGRWVGFVSSADAEAAAAESEYKALSRAVG